MMRVVDAEGQFVGFVKEIKGQDLVIGRPSACDMSTEGVKLSLDAHEVARMGQRAQDNNWGWGPRRSGS